MIGYCKDLSLAGIGKTSQIRKHWHLSDLIATALLAILAAWLFRRHIRGAVTYFGNPDRLNNHLKVLKHHVDSLASGHLDAWSDIELLGYDTFSLPYTFPNPLTWINYWLGPEDIYVTSGYVAAMLLALAGISAYAALRHFVEKPFAALIGAVLYEFSTITILKVSQNDMSFAVFILIPLLIIAVKHIDGRRLALNYVILSALLFGLLQFTFLQKAAYAVLFIGGYALFRSWQTRDWRPLTIFFSAGLTALVVGFPRIWSLGVALSQYTRGDSDRGPQIILSREILRWLDNTLFGRSYADPVTLMNGANLSEGFLLYVSCFAPLLVLYGVLRYRSRWFGLFLDRRTEVFFFSCVLVLVFLVFLSTPVLILVYHVFFEVDFIHARILIIGVFPMVLIISLLLDELQPETTPPSALAWVWALGIASALVLGIEAIAALAQGAWRAPTTDIPLFLDRGAITRIALSTIVTGGVVAALNGKLLSPGMMNIAYRAFSMAMAVQVLHAANFQLNGPQTRGEIPFNKGGFYAALRSDFRVPSALEISSLHATLQRDRFRNVLICDEKIAGGFCAAHIGQFWQLRLADGYYGMGVPKRIAVLPWDENLQMRHIIFSKRSKLPWDLLGFLNVKQALVADDQLYRNPGRDADTGELSAPHRHPEIIENPRRVTPRAFFPRQVNAVDSAGEASRRIFSGNAITDVTEVSFVEGFDKSADFDASGEASVRGRGDNITVVTNQSTKPRFLVLNEQFYPGWTAWIDGRRTVIYPTNAVMRGVMVPPGATTVSFRYQPFVRSVPAKILYSIGFLIFVLGVFVFRRFSTR